MKQTGELLKTARENANLSLSEVALSTKINPKILTAIENGDMTNLPAKTFLKGFVRSYAVFLKIDADDVMKVFQAETSGAPAPVINPEEIRQQNDPAAPTSAPKETPTPAAKQRRVGDDETFSGLRAVAVTVIVVLIGVIIGVRELIEKYQREKVVEASTELKVIPLANQEPEKKEDAKTEEKKEQPATASKALDKLAEIKTQPVEVKKDEPKKELAAVEVKKVEPPPVPSPVPVAKPLEVKKEEPKPASVEPKPEQILKTAKTEIILEALDKVEVKFKVHGEAKILSLGPTQVHTIFADEPMVLDLSDGGAVNIILNGRERGVPGDLGKPKQVKIP